MKTDYALSVTWLSINFSQRYVSEFHLSCMAALSPRDSRTSNKTRKWHLCISLQKPTQPSKWLWYYTVRKAFLMWHGEQSQFSFWSPVRRGGGGIKKHFISWNCDAGFGAVQCTHHVNIYNWVIFNDLIFACGLPLKLRHLTRWKCAAAG